MFRDGVGQHVRSVGEDDLLLDVLQPVHVDPCGPCRPAGQGLLLRTLGDSPPTQQLPISSVADSGSGFPDLGSRVPNPYF